MALYSWQLIGSQIGSQPINWLWSKSKLRRDWLIRDINIYHQKPGRPAQLPIQEMANHDLPDYGQAQGNLFTKWWVPIAAGHVGPTNVTKGVEWQANHRIAQVVGGGTRRQDSGIEGSFWLITGRRAQQQSKQQSADSGQVHNQTLQPRVWIWQN